MRLVIQYIQWIKFSIQWFLGCIVGLLFLILQIVLYLKSIVYSYSFRKFLETNFIKSKSFIPPEKKEEWIGDLHEEINNQFLNGELKPKWFLYSHAILIVVIAAIRIKISNCLENISKVKFKQPNDTV